MPVIPALGRLRRIGTQPELLRPCLRKQRMYFVVSVERDGRCHGASLYGREAGNRIGRKALLSEHHSLLSFHVWNRAGLSPRPSAH